MPVACCEGVAETEDAEGVVIIIVVCGHWMENECMYRVGYVCMYLLYKTGK